MFISANCKDEIPTIKKEKYVYAEYVHGKRNKTCRYYELSKFLRCDGRLDVRFLSIATAKQSDPVWGVGRAI